MKILLVNSVYGIGSTGKIVRDLEQEIVKEGHEVKVCYGRYGPITSRNTVQVTSKLEFYIDALLSRITGLHGCFSLFSTHRLIKEIEFFQPDIVHLHNIHGYYVNVYKIVNFLKKNKIRVIWTLHDELMFTGKCSYAYECDKWRDKCEECPHVKDYPKSLFFDFSRVLFKWKRECFKNINEFCFVTPSKWLANRVKDSILGEAECKVINNGIDTTNVFFKRDTAELRSKLNIGDKKVVLTVTDDVYSERKGISTFVGLADIFVDEDVTFIIVGGEREDLKRDNVIYIKRTNNQIELSQYYSLADVFVITSKCDNFPTVCLEALACGTPVVGFNVGGIPETAPAETVGRFSQIGDNRSLLKNVQHYLNINSTSVVMECRSVAETNFDRKSMNIAYLELYKERLRKV